MHKDTVGKDRVGGDANADRPQGQKNSSDPKSNVPAGPRFLRMYFIVLALTIGSMWIWRGVFDPYSSTTITYSEFKQRLAAGEVSEVVVTESEVRGVMEPDQEGASSSSQLPEGQLRTDSQDMRLVDGQAYFRTIRVDDPDLIDELTAAGVRFSGMRPSLISQFLLSWILPLAFIFFLWTLLARRLNPMGSSMLSIGKSKAKLIADKSTGVTFDDVAGCEEAKHELKEVVSFLQAPDRYKALGAQVPKGVLLVGPPGTGKTLMARAVAGEAGVAFFSIAGSDFVEMFVGIGAARVRDLFKEAKVQAPCIIFIDEIDAIGRHRSVHVGAVNDEREQTLNQLLSEMDGFEPNNGVIVLAATNRPEVLDRALLRPGRFDRQVVIDAPDMVGREAILRVHTRNKPLDRGVDLHKIARATAGFAGADLANVVNEAALLAARLGQKMIMQKDLADAVEKVVAGPERKSRLLGESEKRRVAFHEAGHALVAAACKNADPVRKISIVPRGRSALGYTLQLPEGEQFLLTESALVDRIRSLLGGRAAEELSFQEVSTGAENDLEKATAIARQMVGFYGMGRSAGLAHFGQQRSAFVPGDSGEGLSRNCSEETARLLDEDVQAILREAYADAKAVINDNLDVLEALASELLQHEILDELDLQRLLAPVKTPSSRPPPWQGAAAAFPDRHLHPPM